MMYTNVWTQPCTTPLWPSSEIHSTDEGVGTEASQEAVVLADPEEMTVDDIAFVEVPSWPPDSEMSLETWWRSMSEASSTVSWD
jgi:hypothetical protein